MRGGQGRRRPAAPPDPRGDRQGDASGSARSDAQLMPGPAAAVTLRGGRHRARCGWRGRKAEAGGAMALCLGREVARPIRCKVSVDDVAASVRGLFRSTAIPPPDCATSGGLGQGLRMRRGAGRAEGCHPSGGECREGAQLRSGAGGRPEALQSDLLIAPQAAVWGRGHCGRVGGPVGQQLAARAVARVAGAGGMRPLKGMGQSRSAAIPPADCATRGG